MFGSLRLGAFGILALCAGTGAASADVVFTDSTFNPANYGPAFTTYLADPANTATFAQCASCGNPGQALQLTLTEPNGGGTGPAGNSILTGIVNSTFTYNPGTQGAITSISASVDKDLTDNVFTSLGNFFRPLIEQDGNFYAAAIAGPPLVVISSAGGTTGYNTISNSNLVAANFLEINPSTGGFGTANPNFDGDPIVFGIAQALGATTFDGTIVLVDFDNLNITVNSAVPEPTSLALFGTGLFGFAWMRRRKKAA
jgi:hypothetical protein